MTTEALIPRRALRTDIPACAGIVAGWEQATDWLKGGPDAETLAGYIDAAFDAREIWVIGDPVAGYASFNPVTNQLVAIYCRPTGSGLGKILMDRVKAGRDHLWLTTHLPNSAAQRFYFREGFEKTAELPGEPPHEAVPLLRMDWRSPADE